MTVNVITMLRNLRPFAKPEHRVLSLPSQTKKSPTEMGDKFVSRHSSKTITAKVVRMHYPRDA